MSQSRQYNCSASNVTRTGSPILNPQAVEFVPAGLEDHEHVYPISRVFMMDPRVSEFNPQTPEFDLLSMETMGACWINNMPPGTQDIFEGFHDNAGLTITMPEDVHYTMDPTFFDEDQPDALPDLEFDLESDPANVFQSIEDNNGLDNVQHDRYHRVSTKKSGGRKRSRANSGATNARIKKTKSQKPASRKPSLSAVAHVEDLLTASIAEKQRLAGQVIKQQQGEAEEAKRLGQEIRIVKTDGCPEIEGIYWRAPKNDDSIPKTPAAKKACFDQVYAAILNTTGCKEVTTKKAFKIRWGEEKSHYEDGDLIRVGWKVVVRCHPTVKHPYNEMLTSTSEDSGSDPRRRLDSGDQRSCPPQLHPDDHVLHVQRSSGWSCQAPQGMSAHFHSPYLQLLTSSHRSRSRHARR
jgi:hypothetical protein